MEIKDITKKMNNNDKILLLKKLAVELSDMEYISDMINEWGNFQDAKNYVSLSITNIILDFHI